MRVIVIGLVIILVALSCGLTIRYNQNATQAQEELNGERYRRMVLEEGLQNANQRISTLDAQLKSAQAKIESSEQFLNQTMAINKDLKARLDKAAEIQASLSKRIADLQLLTTPL